MEINYQIDYDKLYTEIKLNKNGKPNKNSLKKIERIDRAVEVLKHYDGDESLFFHHMSLIAGTMPRSKPCFIHPYNGQYGEGICVDVPNYGKGSKFFKRFYFIEKEMTDNGLSTNKN